MKILSLEIHNIASIEHASIDFANGPLASDPIFLITGDTGAGKTTILNAICLALYDKVPTLESIGSAEKDRDAVQTDNTRQLMRKGAGEAYVELDFVGNDDKRYRASWNVWRARKKADGKMQDTQRRLLALADGSVLTRITDIDARIRELVGLSFEQFTRTTMLAQGQFATFMKATDKDKSDILEKLTGTDIYSRIGKKVFELYSDKKAECAQLQSLIDEMKLLTADEKEQHALAIERLAARISELAVAIDSADKQLQWLDTHNTFTRKLVTTQAALTQAQAALESDEVKQAATTVKGWDDTADVRRLLADQAKGKRQMGRLQQEMQQLATDAWIKVVMSIKFLRNELDAKQREVMELAAAVERQQPLAPLYASAEVIAEKARTMTETAGRISMLNAEAVDLNRQLEQSRLKELPMQQALGDAIDVLANAKTTMDGAHEEAQKYDLKRLTSEYTKATEQVRKVDNTIAAVTDYQRALEDHGKAAEALAKARDAVAVTQQALAQAKGKLPDARERLTHAEAYRDGQMELSDHIASMRECFAHTGVCPLCGNDHAQMRDDHAISAMLEAAKAEAANAKREVDDINSAISAAEAKLKIETADERRKKGEEQAKREALDAAIAKAKELEPAYASPDCLQQAQRTKLLAEIKCQMAQDSLAEATTKNNAWKVAADQYNQARDNKERAEKALADQQKATADLASKIKSNADQREQLADYLGKQHAEVLGLVDADATAKRMLAEAGLDFADPGRVSASARKLKDMAKKCAAAVETHAKALRDAENAERHHSECVANTRALSQRFGIDPNVPHRLSPRLDDKIRQLNGDVARLDGQIGECARGLEQVAAQIADWCERGIMPLDEVERLAAIAPEAVESYRVKVDNARKAVTTAAAQIETLAGQLAEHDALKPEIEAEATAESLAESKRLLNEERDGATSERARIKAVLEADRKAAEKQAGNIKQLEKMRQELTLWKELDDAFGGSDGARFKKVAQSYVLRALLCKANYYLDMLAHRFRLDCEDGSLTINVIDNDHLGTLRNVGLLSGGESFVVSLALALGLSSISKDRINVDTLFIDEGFGTLDKNILNTVIDALDRLHNIGGRRIGIISHVQDLKERIPTQIVVKRTGANTSQVEVITA